MHLSSKHFSRKINTFMDIVCIRCKAEAEKYYSRILRVAQKWRFIINPVYLEVVPWLPKFGILGSLEESLKNAFFRTLFSPKLILESWIPHCLCESFPEYPLEITIETLIIVYLIQQEFSWFKNHKLLIDKLGPGPFFASSKTVSVLMLLLTRIYCLW